MALTWTNDETELLEDLRKVGVKVGVVVNEPWVYECGLKDPLLHDKSTCLFPGIGMEIARNLCAMLAIPCQFIRLDYSSNMTKQAGVDTYKPDYQVRSFEDWSKENKRGGRREFNCRDLLKPCRS